MSEAPSPKLKAKRRPPPLRLVEHGDDDPREKPQLGIPTDLSDQPIGLMRLGGADLEAGMRACAAGPHPTGIVMSIAENPSTSSRARRLSGEFEVARLIDPLLFRTGLDGYRTAPNLQTLDYTPGRDADPFRPEEFDDEDLANQIARSVVGAQVDLGGSGAFCGSFVMDQIDSRWVSVNQRLLRIGADAAAAWGIPHLAAVPIRIHGFERLREQQLLVRALSARRPTAWYLSVDGVSEGSGVDRIFSVVSLADQLRLQGAPVILARAGDLRELFWALGFGIEFGLGRMLRFSVPDYSRGRRGPGPVAGPRVELPSLASSISSQRALDLIAKGLVAEAECGCPACRRDGSLGSRPENVPEHDAHLIIGRSAALTGVGLETRVANLDRSLEAAIHEWHSVNREGGGLGRPTQLERRRQILARAVEGGLRGLEGHSQKLRLVD